MRPIRQAVLASSARLDPAELVESSEAEICYVENEHLPDEVAGAKPRVGYVSSAPLVGTSREGGIG